MIFLDIFDTNRDENNISFEELVDNDHLRVQKRQIGGKSSKDEKEAEDTTLDQTK